MSDITHMGLPQGLPEMLGNNVVNPGVNDWVIKFSEPAMWHFPREMVAADLGLPLGQWAVDWLNATYGPCTPPLWMWLERPPEPLAMDFVLGRWTNAPYSFWLGADHG
jgi:hypothetical protein